MGKLLRRELNFAVEGGLAKERRDVFANVSFQNSALNKVVR